MDRRDWLLLFLCDNPRRVEPREFDPLRIQKAMFLLWKAAGIPEREAYNFRADDYGPLSPELYLDIEALAREQMVTGRPEPGRRYVHYRATAQACETACEIGERPEAQRYALHLEVIRELLAQLDFAQIVGGLYAAYPEFAVVTVAPELAPEGSRAPRPDVRTLFTPAEIDMRAGVLRGMREIKSGKYSTRAELRALLNGA